MGTSQGSHTSPREPKVPTMSFQAANQTSGAILEKTADVPSGGVVRLSVNLSPDVAGALRWIAEKHRITITEAVRRAISTQKFIEDAADRKAKVLLQEMNDDTLKEVIFVR
jgi:predicted transcriptional regulator